MSTPHTPRHTVRPDVLRWSIFLALVASPHAPLLASGVQPAPGPGGTPLVNDAHGIPVVGIVAPNAAGLSHNQYFVYNVGKPGVVLNNALEAGQSQLAGALQANPQFQGQAASTILNEVISRNASLIEGPQEIFGRPADYILANSNGITVNGGSFINTTHASLVVGKPLIEDGHLKLFDTFDAAAGLGVAEGGLINAQGALSLIAPRIESLGLLQPEGDLEVIAGRNRITADNRVVLEHAPGVPMSIDASLFGAMRAGRIRVVSTGEGAGVRVGAVEVVGRDGISIQSAGDLHIGNQGQQQARLRSSGDLNLTAQGDLRLQATQGEAATVQIKAGQKLTLDTSSRQTIGHDREQWDDNWWFYTAQTYERDTTTTDDTLQGTRLQAHDRMTLQSGGDTRLTAARLDAGGELELESGGRLDIEAGKEGQRIEERIRHRKHLWRGDSDSDQYSEQARPSELRGAKVTAKAADTLKIEGSQVHSQHDMSLTGQQVEVVTTQLERRGETRDFRGDLVSGTFFGDRTGQDQAAKQAQGSAVTAGGNLAVVADAVTLRGSKVASAGESVLYSEKGALRIEADHSHSKTTDRQSDSKVFGLIGSNQSHTQDLSEVVSSDVSSQSDLRLASAEEVRIHGSRVEAGKALKVDAKADLIVDSTQSRKVDETAQQQRDFTASARQTKAAEGDKPGSRQFEAGVGYEVANHQQTRQETTQVASELKGGTVDLRSDAHLQVNGSTVQAKEGDLDIQAQKVTLGATHHQQDTRTHDSRSGGGVLLTGGIDRLGSAFDGKHEADETTRHASQTRRSELQAKGDLRLQAQELVTEAAKVEALGDLLVDAAQIDNRAVQDVDDEQRLTRNWRGTLGASVEYRDVTRPIERVIQGEEAARFQQASPEDAMVAPSVGGDMTIEHFKRLENQRRGIAQVSEFSGGKVQVNATDIVDQGTAWRADNGRLDITANTHHMRAAHDQSTVTRNDLTVGGDLRVDTSSGSDVNVRVAGKGGSLEREAVTQTARPGSLQGQRGIQVQLGSAGVYEGTRIDGGDGDVRIKSGGALSLPQASDTTGEQSRVTDGNAWAKVGNRPTNIGGDTRGYLDNTHLQSADVKAQVAQIDAKGEVSLTSTGDLMLEGTRIGSRDAKVAAIELHSDGVVQVKAAHDTHEASGGTLGGGLELGLKSGTGKGGSIGGHFASGKVKEQDSSAVDASFDSNGKLLISSDAREAVAVHLEGLQASASEIALKADNGGLLVEASDNQERRDNLEITAGAGFAMNLGETKEQNVRGLHGRGLVELDRRDNQTWNTSHLRADRIELISRGDTRLEGTRLEAKGIAGSAGGDLLLASRKDRVDNLTVKADARLSHEKNPQGYLNAAKSVAGPAGNKVGEKAGPLLGQIDPNLSPTLSVEVSHVQRDTVAQQASLQGSEKVSLNVGGDARLVGAKIQSVGGDIDLQAGSVTRETLSGRDYRRDVSIDASNSPVDLGTAITQATKGKGAADGENALDLGLLRTSGHNRSERWESSAH